MTSRQADLLPDDNDHGRIRNLLARAARTPSTMWAYAAATRTPCTAPADEIMLMEAGHCAVVAFWVGHPDSFTGGNRHRICSTGGLSTAMIRQWSTWVLELADHVDRAGGDQSGGGEDGAGFALRLQAAHLRWSAAYMSAAHFSDQVWDLVHEQFPDGRIPAEQPGVGDLTRNDLRHLAALTRPGVTPPGWDRDGWDYTRPTAKHVLNTSLARCLNTHGDQGGGR
ncbi:hypothetical protein [Actinomadura roseirufa]|uniref:hypothetical protein n=1 Tax=Actinomadura roseirufa TaxID=2094049 RepID=UPI001040FB8F|nr:hypothetical protein [Actinomadura roseirufa]